MADDAKKDDTKKDDDKKTDEVENTFGQKLIDICRSKYEGKFNYRMGGNGDDGTFDCSGFVVAAFKDVGVDLGAREADQIAEVCKSNGCLFESAADVIAGDIVFYKNTYDAGATANNNGITHIGICVDTETQIDCGSGGISERKYLDYDKIYGRRKEQTIPLGAHVKKITGKPGDKDKDKKPQGKKGIRVTPLGGDWVLLTKLPEKKTFAEPIYPDLVTVSDKVPAWVLSKVTDKKNQDTADASGQNIADGESSNPVAPNGMHYRSDDIKKLTDAGKTQQQAIDELSKQDFYTRPVKKNADGTYDVVTKDAKLLPGDVEDSSHSHGKGASGKYYANNDWDYIKNAHKDWTDEQIKYALDISDTYKKVETPPAVSSVTAPQPKTPDPTPTPTPAPTPGGDTTDAEKKQEEFFKKRDEWSKKCSEIATLNDQRTNQRAEYIAKQMEPYDNRSDSATGTYDNDRNAALLRCQNQLRLSWIGVLDLEQKKGSGMDQYLIDNFGLSSSVVSEYHDALSTAESKRNEFGLQANSLYPNEEYPPEPTMQ